MDGQLETYIDTMRRLTAQFHRYNVFSVTCCFDTVQAQVQLMPVSITDIWREREFTVCWMGSSFWFERPDARVTWVAPASMAQELGPAVRDSRALWERALAMKAAGTTEMAAAGEE